MVKVEREDGRNNYWCGVIYIFNLFSEGSPTVAPSEVRRSDPATGADFRMQTA